MVNASERCCLWVRGGEWTCPSQEAPAHFLVALELGVVSLVSL